MRYPYLDPLAGRLTHFGISHAELSREAGMHASAVSRLLRGTHEPRMSTITKLEQAIFRIRRLRKANAVLKRAGRGRRV